MSETAYKYNETQVEAIFEILAGGEAEKDVKAFLVMELLHDGGVSRARAMELMQECGVFSDHWVAMDAKATEFFEPIYKRIAERKEKIQEKG